VQPTFPESESELTKRFESVLASGLSAYLRTTRTHREAVELNRRFAAYATFFIMVLCASLYIVNYTKGQAVFWVLAGTLILWLVIFFMYGRKWLHDTRLLNRELNMALVPIITNAVDVPVLFQHGKRYRAEVAALLNSSVAVSANNCDIVSDDVYVAYDDADLNFRSLQVISNKSSTAHKTHFTGLLFEFQLETNFKEPLVVTSMDDSTFSTLMCDSRLSLSDLVVEGKPNQRFKATDIVAARKHLLVSGVLDEISAWQDTGSYEFVVTITKNRFVLLLRGVQVVIPVSTTSVKVQHIRRIALPVIKTIWRGVKLSRMVRAHDFS
jgi:hypothetical protein